MVSGRRASPARSGEAIASRRGGPGDGHRALRTLSSPTSRPPGARHFGQPVAVGRGGLRRLAGAGGSALRRRARPAHRRHRAGSSPRVDRPAAVAHAAEARPARRPDAASRLRCRTLGPRRAGTRADEPAGPQTPPRRAAGARVLVTTSQDRGAPREGSAGDLTLRAGSGRGRTRGRGREAAPLSRAAVLPTSWCSTCAPTSRTRSCFPTNGRSAIRRRAHLRRAPRPPGLFIAGRLRRPESRSC
jgi:hypothetical protein